MATELEYGPELRSRISPLITGVGPVEAAASVTERLTRLSLEDKLPLMLVSLGSAGSARLEQCGLYQASSVAWRDMDASALGFEIGVVPFLDQPATIGLGPFVPGIPLASLSTGANIVSGLVYDRIEEDMVEMETYAVLRAGQRFGLPLIALRGISDGDACMGRSPRRPISCWLPWPFGNRAEKAGFPPYSSPFDGQLTTGGHPALR
jgi:adenosylhomocysteine nucleosidase